MFSGLEMDTITKVESIIFTGRWKVAPVAVFAVKR